MRVAVVGHSEWCEFAEVPHVPQPGEIVHAAKTFEEPAGGGAVAAVQLRKLAGEAMLFTAFGDDETGHRTDAELREHGVRVEGRFTPSRSGAPSCTSTRTASARSRCLGRGLARRPPTAFRGSSSTTPTPSTSRPATSTPCARPAGRARSWPRRAGSTRSPRRTCSSTHSCRAAATRASVTPWRPGSRAEDRGADARSNRGRVGHGQRRDGSLGRRLSCRARSARSSYGARDSFAAGLTYGLGAGWEIAKAVELAARCGAACLTGRGPYEGQLVLEG